MSDPDGQTPDAVDECVEGYLSRTIHAADATQLINRIRATRAASGASVENPKAGVDRVVSRRYPPVWSWAAITLLAVGGAFLGGRYVGPRSANAAVMLRDVSAEHAQAIDRCYRVQYSPDPRYWDGKNQLEGPSTSVMWTRGDRFWSDCSVGNVRLKIGQDSDGVLWVSPSASKGIRFTNHRSELPPVVSLVCEINSMVVPKLIDEVLKDFDLQKEFTLADKGQRGRTLILARLKPGRTHPLLSDALLEIDSETHELKRLVLWTVRDGQPKGVVTYSLIESSTATGSLTDSVDQYRLESHVDPDAEIERGTLTIATESLSAPSPETHDID